MITLLENNVCTKVHTIRVMVDFLTSVTVHREYELFVGFNVWKDFVFVCFSRFIHFLLFLCTCHNFRGIENWRVSES